MFTGMQQGWGMLGPVAWCTRAARTSRCQAAFCCENVPRTKAMLRGTWCSGITSAPHAEGPGFKSQCVQSFATGDAWAAARSLGMSLGLQPQLQHPELANGEPPLRGSRVNAQMPSGKPHTHTKISHHTPFLLLPFRAARLAHHGREACWHGMAPSRYGGWHTQQQE